MFLNEKFNVILLCTSPKQEKVQKNIIKKASKNVTFNNDEL